ncbi:MAG: hypothetical protein ACI8P9_001418 [Parasphingorhabdus sp.]|jgi:hypothetical protein
MHQIIDLKRYPLDQLNSPEGRKLVSRCRDDLTHTGMFNLVGLMLPDAIDKLVTQTTPLFETQAFTHSRMHNIYFLPSVPGLAADHPVLQQFETTNRTLCSDQIPNSALIKLYEWEPFAAFLAAVLDKPQLHPMDDQLARLNLMAYDQGEALNWHFDRSEFTTTLLLQSPERGGEFQYRNGLRSDEDANYAGVGKFLDHEQASASSLQLSAGTLNVFRGKNTAHRVTPVEGRRKRIIAVFSYYEKAGVQFSAEEKVGFYGRAD